MSGKFWQTLAQIAGVCLCMPHGHVRVVCFRTVTGTSTDRQRPMLLHACPMQDANRAHVTTRNERSNITEKGELGTATTTPTMFGQVRANSAFWHICVRVILSGVLVGHHQRRWERRMPKLRKHRHPRGRQPECRIDPGNPKCARNATDRQFEETRRSQNKSGISH